MNEFTVEDGLKVQQEGLKFWKTVLKDEVYLALEAETTKRNWQLDRLPDGFGVWRGKSMDNFVFNYRSKQPTT